MTSMARIISPFKFVRARTFLLAFLSSALLLIAADQAEAQTETVLHRFTGDADGANPSSNLTSDGAGNFYGTTFYGGAT
jgi:hypothetical protein